ncbi:D-glycero-beta-D-manno-heptose 1-phosphate adenylyltransferase [Microbacterium sp. AZCO]|uniref:D-glycero-beta-D-manno-heptose 1-phosphate adenylyltransferase n=1 Tax=Microbacterium sp. AZCO TaxID=3142976 RepID=UPI0031F41F85
MAHAPAELLALARSTPPQVVVAGDAMLDRWLRGGVRRLSREGPVPVVEVGAADERPGGAANTAANLAALGARVRFTTVVGDDDEGRALARLLGGEGVDTADWVVRTRGATTSKTRVVGNDQMIVRLDAATHDPLDPADRAAWLAALARAARAETLLVCDYGTGLFDEAALDVLTATRPGRLIVDAHDLRPWARVHPDVVLPNADEASTLLERPLPEGPRRVSAVAACAPRLHETSGSTAVVVTLDRDGTLLLQNARVAHRTVAHPVPDGQTIGAGDTFAAGFTVACALGASLAEACDFAQGAADVAVSRPGTTVCTLADLAAASESASHIVDLATLSAAVAEARARRLRIVFTNGCFDLLHPGHAAHLEQAKAQGDVLVVALNDDASVRRLKGPGRPVSPVADRARVVAALACVDYVVVFSGDSPAALLAELEPELYVKGGDYTPEMLDETAIVQAYGGEVRILDFIAAHSTSRLVERIASAAAPTAPGS